MKRWSTVQTFIDSGRAPTSETVAAFEGFASKGDGGASLWVKTGLTGTASQSPIERGDNKLTDSSGVEYEPTKGTAFYFDGTNQWFPSPFGDSGAGLYQYNGSGWDYYEEAGGAVSIAVTSDLILSSFDYDIGTALDFKGYGSPGDGGAAQWVKTSDTGTPSQSPAQRGDGTLTDATGAVWVKSYGNSVAVYESTAALESSLPEFTGQRAENRERANAQYVLAAAGYAAQPGDITAANGRVWELLLSGFESLLKFGVTEVGDQGVNITSAASRHKYLHIPAGVVITASNINLDGASLTAGKGGTIKESGSSSSYTFTNSGSGESLIYGVTFDGGNTDDVRCGIFSGQSSVIFDSVNIKNYIERAVFFGQDVGGVNINNGVYQDLENEAFCFLNRNTTINGGVYKDIVGHALRFGRFNTDDDELSGEMSCVSGCIFENVQNNPILYEIDSRDGIVTDCLAINSRGLVKVESSADVGDRASRVTISSNRIMDNVGVIPTGIDGNTSVNLVITGNYIDNCYDGISAGDDCIISDNTIMNASNISVRLVGDRSKITGNSVSGTGDTGLRISGNDVTCQNNSVFNSTSSGINISDSNSPLIQGNRVKGCDINIRIFSSCTDGFVVGNFTSNSVSSEISNASVSTTVSDNYTQ